MEPKIDPKLQGIIEGIFRHCIDDGEYKQVTDKLIHTKYVVNV